MSSNPSASRDIELRRFEAAVRVNWAIARLLEGNAPQALAELSSAIQLDPLRGDALALRGALCCGWFGMCDPDGAIRDLSAAIQIMGDSAVLYLCRAQALLLRQDFARAAMDCDRALALDPDCALAVDLRGRASLALKHTQQAIADFTQAIELDVDVQEI